MEKRFGQLTATKEFLLYKRRHIFLCLTEQRHAYMLYIPLMYMKCCINFGSKYVCKYQQGKRYTH